MIAFLPFSTALSSGCWTIWGKDSGRPSSGRMVKVADDVAFSPTPARKCGERESERGGKIGVIVERRSSREREVEGRWRNLGGNNVHRGERREK